MRTAVNGPVCESLLHGGTYENTMTASTATTLPTRLGLSVPCPNVRSAKRISFSIARVVARLIATMMFHVRCRGREHWPRTGGAIVCANHQSYFDPVLVGLSCDRPLNYVARQSLFKFAPFRWLINWYGAIPIEREGLGIGGLKEMLRRLKREELVLMFPEGTRTVDGEVGRLHPGIARWPVGQTCRSSLSGSTAPISRGHAKQRDRAWRQFMCISAHPSCPSRFSRSMTNNSLKRFMAASWLVTPRLGKAGHARCSPPVWCCPNDA